MSCTDVPTVIVPDERTVPIVVDVLLTVNTAALAVWPSGFVTVIVRVPGVAPTVEMLSVACVRSV